MAGGSASKSVDAVSQRQWVNRKEKEKEKESTRQKKEPKITFFGEGHLKTLYKGGREDKGQISEEFKSQKNREEDRKDTDTRSVSAAKRLS